MGWLYMHRAGMGGLDTPKAYLDNQLTWERENEETGTFEGCRVIRSVSTTGAYYAAVQRYGPNNQTHAISAVICLVRWNPKAADGLLFGYKDMDENSGPVEAGCPRSILEELGPTNHPYALDWRNRCYRQLRLKERKIADGDMIRLPEPIKFTDGSEHAEFRVTKRGAKIELSTPDGRGRFRISRLMERRFEVVSPKREECARLTKEDRLGVFSLAGKDTRISSRHANADTGWSVHVPADGWTGAQDVAVVPLARPVGTTISFLMPGVSEQTAERILREVTKFYPLPVFFNGTEMPREDFLAKAIYIAEWNGSQIGVFEGREYHQDPTTNFHGLVLNRKLASVSESLGGKTYHARLDIGSTPGLALVLPARKEFVENAAFAALQAACKRTIYAALAHKGQHRLSFENWKEARDLRVALPEADPCLPRWHAAIAESDNVNVEYEEVAAGADTILVADLEPDIAQGLERALREHPLRPHLVENHPAYAGYGWYNALHQLGNVRFYVAAGEQGHVIAENGSFPPLDDHVRAETIELRFCVFHRASETQREERIPADVAFVVGEDGWYSGVDQIRIAYVPGPALTPETLVDLIENVCFCASDDSEADSWDTQHEHFLRDARELAARVLLGEDEAIAARIRDTLAGILWIIPKNRQVAITVAPGTAINVQLSACQPAG